MEKFVDMMSPFTGGRVKEVSAVEEKEFRKEKFLVHVRYYVCEDTGEQFTTTEQDTLLFNDLYSQYRTRHGIPFPEEIKEIRERYHLNYTQISRILGFGANQYAKYESGEVPSESNGKMIAAIRHKNVLMNLLKDCEAQFTAAEYQRIKSSLERHERTEDEDSALRKIIYSSKGRNLLNGYGRESVAKLSDMVRSIVTREGEVFPTKLNKLMFYTDFYHYRKTGQSISGLRYVALNFGPVPDHYATIYDNIPGLEKRMIDAHGMPTALITCGDASLPGLLSESEIDSINKVVGQLKSLSVAEIIEASHRENAWTNHSSGHSYIPYDEAFTLKLV